MNINSQPIPIVIPLWAKILGVLLLVAAIAIPIIVVLTGKKGPSPGPSPQKYSCKNNTCVKDENGTYTSSNCNSECSTSPQKYSCKNNTCVKDENGTYTSSNCNSECSTSPQKYSCKNNTCVKDENGTYTSSNCNSECSTSPQKYSCKNNTCVKDENGTYTSSNCNSECSTSPPPPPPPPPTGRWERIGFLRMTNNFPGTLPTAVGDLTYTTASTDPPFATNIYDFSIDRQADPVYLGTDGKCKYKITYDDQSVGSGISTITGTWKQNTNLQAPAVGGFEWVQGDSEFTNTDSMPFLGLQLNAAQNTWNNPWLLTTPAPNNVINGYPAWSCMGIINSGGPDPKNPTQTLPYDGHVGCKQFGYTQTAFPPFGTCEIEIWRQPVTTTDEYTWKSLPYGENKPVTKYRCCKTDPNCKGDKNECLFPNGFWVNWSDDDSLNNDAGVY